MEDQLIAFETAKLAKEKGFNEKTNFAFYYDGTQTWNDPGYDILIARPTQSLLQKWLREKYRIDITVWIRFDQSYGVLLCKDRNRIGEEIIISVTSKNLGNNLYELALEQGLYEALKLIK